MNPPQEAKAKSAVLEAAAYLRYTGIRLPHFRVTTLPSGGATFGGSFVDGFGGTLRVNMGHYPIAFLRRWFAMHELGHVLWDLHRPLRWKSFRKEFGEPDPEDYENKAREEAWKTAASWRFSKVSGPHRPKGQPSWYGARAGGQERFCELLGLLWAHGDFTKDPPGDLSKLWSCCQEHGLSRMI
jgi:hypothetical protein